MMSFIEQIKSLLTIILLFLVFPFLSLPAYADSCLSLFSSHSQNETISNDVSLNVVTLAKRFPKIYRPFFLPLVFVQETPYSRLAEHEVRTAIQYAEHLKSRGLEFVLIADYNGKSVPVFDGIVIDPSTGVPLFNVSLKFSSVRMRRMNAATLIESLEGRLNNSYERADLKTEENWQRKNAPTRKQQNLPETQATIQDLTALFGLHWPNNNPFGREYRTVLDMSESGYTFEFVSDPNIIQAINQLVLSSGRPETLTLIWEGHQVLNFPLE